MSVPRQYTPLPEQALAPVLVEVPDWHDLNANSTHTVLEQDRFAGQAIDVVKVGGRPEPSVDVEVEATAAEERGEETDKQTVTTTALGNFNFPVDTGPVATERLVWRTINNSGTAYTDGGNDPYQTFIAYAIRPITVIEKLRRNLVLNSTEQALAEKTFAGESMSVLDKVELNIPPEEDPAFDPNLDGKNVIETDAVASTVDLSSTGVSNNVEVADVRSQRDPQTGTKAEILYLTGIGMNTQDFSEDDSIRLRILRDTTEEFARLKTFGGPGIGGGSSAIIGSDGASFPPYLSEWHVPFLDRMTIQVFATSGGTAVNNIDVRVEYARVERTLVEKALYNLADEVRADDPLGPTRQELFTQIQEKLQVGLPIEPEREQAREMAPA